MSDFESKKKENHQNFAGNPFLRVRKIQKIPKIPKIHKSKKSKGPKGGPKGPKEAEGPKEAQRAELLVVNMSPMHSVNRMSIWKALASI